MIDCQTLNTIWIQMLIMYVWIAAVKLSNSSILSEKLFFMSHHRHCLLWQHRNTVSQRAVSKTHSAFGSNTTAYRKRHQNAPGWSKFRSSCELLGRRNQLCELHKFPAQASKSQRAPALCVGLKQPCNASLSTNLCRPPVSPQQGNSTTHRDQLTLCNVL